MRESSEEFEIRPDHHQANMPMQYAVIFKGCRHGRGKKDIFLFFAHNIDFG